MTINATTAQYMAQLSRLELNPSSDGQDQKLIDDFSKIVGYMDILSEVDTTGVEPLYSPQTQVAPPREDLPAADNREKADHLLDEAPERLGRFFAVPRIF